MSIYFIQGSSGGPIKIGWAKDVKERLRKMQVGNPDVLKVVLELQREQREELSMHQRFAADLLRGEWYWASADLVEQIRIMGGEAVAAKSMGASEIQNRLDRMVPVTVAMLRARAAEIVYRAGREEEGLECTILMRWPLKPNIEYLGLEERGCVAEQLKLAAGKCSVRCIAGAVQPREVSLLIYLPTNRSLDSIAKGIKSASSDLLSKGRLKFRDACFFSKLWSENTHYSSVCDDTDMSPVLRGSKWF